MAPSIPQLIAGINPNLYFDYGNDKSKLNEFKSLIKEKGVTQAIDELSKSNKQIKPKSEEEHNLVYDSSAETLEPIYFFILDMMNDRKLNPEKLVDNFTSTPGGTHFSEIGMKATRMQEETTKMMGTINVVLKSVLNVLYDLRDFEIRLAHHPLCHSSGIVRLCRTLEGILIGFSCQI